MPELFDIIPEAERPSIREAFNYLEADQLGFAIRQFEEVLLGDFSEYAKSFANYGLGVVYHKTATRKSTPTLESLNNSIGYLEESLKTLEFSDAYLMLGTVLRYKAGILSSGRNLGSDNTDLETLTENAFNFLKRAIHLNPNCSDKAIELIREVAEIRWGLGIRWSK